MLRRAAILITAYLIFSGGVILAQETTPEPGFECPNTGELTPGVYEEDAPGITFTGNWTTLLSGNALGGALMRNATPGNTAFFEFCGTYLEIWALQRDFAPDAEFCVDGDCQILATYFGQSATTGPVVAYHVPQGVHSVTITNLSYFWLDAIFVMDTGGAGGGTTVETVVIAPDPDPARVDFTVDPDGDGVGNWVSFEYRVTAGDAMIAALLFLMFTSSIMSPWLGRLISRD